MTRLLCLFVCVAAAGWSTASAVDLMPPHVAARLGLTESWQRTIAAPYGADSISNQNLFVHPSNPHLYVEVIRAGAKPAGPATATKPPKPMTPTAMTATAKPGEAGNMVAPADQPMLAESDVFMRLRVGSTDARGKAIDQKEAERLASNEIRRLTRRGIKTEMRIISVPRIVLYSISDDGTLEARDAETGRSLWMVSVGQRGLHFAELGLDDHFVTVVNGANIIEIDATNGEVESEHRTMGVPAFGAVDVGEFALLVTVNGAIEGYPMADPEKDPFREQVAGRALAMPTRSPDSTKTAWATDQGFVYVMELEGKPSTLFRLNTDGNVAGRIASTTGDRFFFASDTGQVYGIRGTREGDVMWVTPFGEPFYDGPVLIGDRVMVRSTYGRVFCLDINDGTVLWDRPWTNIDELIGAFGDRVYARTLGGGLQVAELTTGKVIATFPEVRPGRLLPNTKSNRLYMVSDRGVVQCLRPIDQPLPTLTVPPTTGLEQEMTGQEEAEKPATTSPFDPPPGGDPFGAGGGDPFGGGGDPFGGGAGGDPFGGGAGDPFGGGAGGGDPFGGGKPMDDPFGGDPFGN